MKLYCIQVGSFEIPPQFIAHKVTNGEVPTLLPIFAYLVEHPDGLVVVDLGQHYDLRDDGSRFEKEDTIVAKLLELGYKPDDIKYVVLSHMHLDHAGYMCDFPNSTFIVRHEELKAAWWPNRTFEQGYVYKTYEMTRAFDFIEPLDNENFDVFGDGKVVLIDTKGHSRGHQSMVLNLQNTGKVVVVCDAAPMREVIDKKLVPGTCADTLEAMRSIDKLLHLEATGHKLIIAHDPKNMPEKVFPEYFD